MTMIDRIGDVCDSCVFFTPDKPVIVEKGNNIDVLVPCRNCEVCLRIVQYYKDKEKVDK
jgi:Pyruvate/2-oxoacid:ferredoxin oxidoreductase delta subunit